MYIDKISLTDIRTFRKTSVELLHPDKKYGGLPFSKPRLGNINLLLGDNGAGKSTFLKAVAIAGIGPALPEASLRTEHFIRRRAGATKPSSRSEPRGELEATFWFMNRTASVRKWSSNPA